MLKRLGVLAALILVTAAPAAWASDYWTFGSNPDGDRAPEFWDRQSLQRTDGEFRVKTALVVLEETATGSTIDLVQISEGRGSCDLGVVWRTPSAVVIYRQGKLFPDPSAKDTEDRDPFAGDMQMTLAEFCAGGAPPGTRIGDLNAARRKIVEATDMYLMPIEPVRPIKNNGMDQVRYTPAETGLPDWAMRYVSWETLRRSDGDAELFMLTLMRVATGQPVHYRLSKMRFDCTKGTVRYLNQSVSRQSPAGNNAIVGSLGPFPTAGLKSTADIQRKACSGTGDSGPTLSAAEALADAERRLGAAD